MRKEPEDYLSALRHTAEVASQWEDDVRSLLHWKMAIMSVSIIGLSMAMPNRQLSHPYTREASHIIRQH